ncbi:MAG: hypothetical protein M0Z53_07040 [Thermaerobacter sp.]|nr:hypothetical protein [Thermaerobacter sp.]
MVRQEKPLTVIEIAGLLEEHADDRTRINQLGRKHLSFGLRGLIWGLRIYVVLMIVAVIANIWQSVGFGPHG